MPVFERADFRVFDVTDFGERMHAIRERIQPRLHQLGAALGPGISALVDLPLYPHVARHARRTVNPPDDTWVAFGPDKRGYKKDVHFKIAISRHALRLLFEVGPEYYARADWTRKWSREFSSLAGPLKSGTQLGWYRDEHDEDPSALLTRMDEAALKGLGREPVARRDGQLVIGRRLDECRVVGMTPESFRKIALGTFRSLAPLFGLHEFRLAAGR